MSYVQSTVYTPLITDGINITTSVLTAGSLYDFSFNAYNYAYPTLSTSYSTSVMCGLNSLTIISGTPPSTSTGLSTKLYFFTTTTNNASSWTFTVPTSRNINILCCGGGNTGQYGNDVSFTQINYGGNGGGTIYVNNLQLFPGITYSISTNLNNDVIFSYSGNNITAYGGTVAGSTYGGSTSNTGIIYTLSLVGNGTSTVHPNSGYLITGLELTNLTTNIKTVLTNNNITKVGDRGGNGGGYRNTEYAKIGTTSTNDYDYIISSHSSWTVITRSGRSSVTTNYDSSTMSPNGVNGVYTQGGGGGANYHDAFISGTHDYPLTSAGTGGSGGPGFVLIEVL